jgi:glycosyltransferase involved in cell wall biosynthesis
MSAYVLITAARNEGRLIADTLDAVLIQKLQPKQWVIVSDGSTDNTDDVVRSYAARVPFIRLCRRDAERRRNFASQVEATREGYAIVGSANVDFVGILDADIRMNSSYYAELVSRMEQNPRIGIAGGNVLDVYHDGTILDPRQGSEGHHVAGGVQFFRKACFDAIGGYLPMPRGGQDVVAGVLARMHGWTVCAYPDLKAYHGKSPPRSGMAGVRQWFNNGVRSYSFGTHPLYAFVRCLHVSDGHPLVGRVAALAGYVYAGLTREPRPVPPEVMAWFRKEQMQRLRARVRSRL